ncbi:MAG TPA: hypothetical protein VD930_13535 [Gemmatimonadales bacterium]|nr:hypothetical protein [Gemmatimonadales bacterium]
MRLNLHDGQARVWESMRRFVFMLAGTQSGKTSFGPLWLLREIGFKGPGDYLAVTSTFKLFKLKMLPEFLRIFEHTLHLGQWRGSEWVFEFDRDDTRIIFGSASNSESLESATAKGAWLDEVGQDDFKLASWEAILRRLSLHEGRVLGTTTLYNLGWLKQEIYDPWRAGDPDIDVIQFDSILNPLFPQTEYDRAKRTLPDWKFSLFYKGQYEKPAGLIYRDFIDQYREEGGHKVRPFDLPAEWPRWSGVDFGGVNTATVWLAKDPAVNVYYLYHESLEGGKASKEHAAIAQRKAAGVNMVAWWGGAKSEGQWRMDWNAAGVNVQEPPVSDVEAGIDRIISLFRTSRLYIFDTCKGVIDELGTYSRELDERNEPTEKIKDKETFHRLDALRYVGSGIEQPPAAGARWDRPDPWEERQRERPSMSMWGRRG